MAPKPVAEDSIEEASAYEIEEAVMYKAMPKPIRSFDDLMSHIGETWQESLFRWIDEKPYNGRKRGKDYEEGINRGCIYP